MALNIVLCSASGESRAQGSIADSTLRMSLFQFHGALYTPGGDMADLYGNHAGVGLGYAYKSGTNWLLGADFTYFFGGNVRNPNAVMRELREAQGRIIDNGGEFVTFLIQQRGLAAGFYAGKILPLFGPNPNSGLVLKLGMQYYEHRTWIEARQNDIPPIEGEYRKGYDRKRAGFAAYQFVGYQHFSDNRYANFYAGLDFFQAFTVDYRSYNIDDRRVTDGSYLDLSLGLRIGWVIPVYRREADKFYLE